jgi:hypothetical protein
MKLETRAPSQALRVAAGSGAILLVLVFILGFFTAGETAVGRAMEPPSPMRKAAVREEEFAAAPMEAHPSGFSGMIERSGRIYYRQAEMQLAVGDTLKGNDDLERIANEHKCEIANLIIEGNDLSRRCSVELLVPSDRFDSLVRQFRKVGRVLHERITAQKIEGSASGSGDSRVEFARVRADLVDDGAQRGLFARAFESSGNHFVRGSALLLEGSGFALPFLLAASFLAGVILLARRIRRARLEA